ncbi:photosynthetic reaction center subunit H [Blastochloris sulfoviridis]|uniref:Photosynthetic reaction center subunit H n=1 Tax=Blastochloris sulfoviridis TaxID=50712 RepID=A0A5M6I5M5_9HYPH|nr:photosynthetic reaction center subunit H [Blastochloris sulfoviridis]KAA5603068.1 photosynthetic reaction center subunit H [Blastochloris sulfoviridis]
MYYGALANHLDIAQLAWYGHWLVIWTVILFYLRREDRREGYPLVEPLGLVKLPSPDVQSGELPYPKTFTLYHGGTVQAPNPNRHMETRELKLAQTDGFEGAPLAPTGNPMVDGVGPASWAERSEVVDSTFEGKAKIVPLRAAPEFFIAEGDLDPRGLPVFGADGIEAGTVTDLWVDRSEYYFRYLEISVAGSARTALMPLGFASITKDGVKVQAILASQFANVPRLQSRDQITLREEDKVSAYYAGGLLYATPERAEPLL